MFGLSFLSPLFLAGALAAAVPIVLHLLRREEAPEVGLATTRFIRRAPVPRAKRLRLRDLVLLALRVLALVLVAWAFARPYLAAAVGAEPPSMTLIAIDTSFSMGGEARQAEVRRQAFDALDRVPAGQQVAVMAFDDDARILSEASADRALARAAIEAAEPGYGGTNYQALTAAVSATFAIRTGTLVVVTDLQRIGWRDGRGLLSEGIEVEVAALPPVTSNLSVPRTTIDGRRVVASVANHGSEAATTLVTLSTESQTIDSREVTIGAGRTLDVAFDQGVPAAGVGRVVVTDPLGLPADDARFVSFDPPSPVPVVVVARDGPRDDIGFFVTKALEVADRTRPVKITLVQGEATVDGLPELTAGTVALLLGTRGLDRVARSAVSDYLTAGGVALMALGPGVDAAVAGEWLGRESGVRILEPRVFGTPAHMTPVQGRHPLFRGFDEAAPSLTRVAFTRAFDLAPGGASVLATFGDGRPALLELVKGRGRLLVLASDLDGAWNDFPRRAAFVPFVQEVVRYLGRGHTGTRDVLVADMPAGVVRRPGPFRVEGQESVMVANVEAEESSPMIDTPDEFRSAIDQSPPLAGTAEAGRARQQERDQTLWRYGLWAALAVLVIEGVVGRVWG